MIRSQPTSIDARDRSIDSAEIAENCAMNDHGHADIAGLRRGSAENAVLNDALRCGRQRKRVMLRYRIHFVDHHDRVFDAIEIERDTDEAALDHAFRVDVPSIGAGFDLWQNHRLVHRHRRN